MSFAEFVRTEWLLFLALGIITFMLIYSFIGERLQGYKEINATQATRLINDGAKLIDVRETTEFKGGWIGEAENIPLTQVKDKAANWADKTAPMVVYCQSGMRSSKACMQLKSLGYTNLHNLSGGIQGWQSASLPVNTKKSVKAAKAKQGA
jgi:phage shock protein E